MTRTFTIRASMVALSTLSLAACATPDYPTQQAPSAAAPPASTPKTTPPPAAPPAVAPPAAETPPPSAAPTPSAAPVEARPLPPVATATQRPTPAPAPQATEAAAAPPPATTPMSPAQQAVPPDYAPPPATSTQQPPAEPAPAPRAPEIRYRTTPERIVAGGRVVAARGMYRDYVVAPKDHVDAIARDLQTTRKVLVEANHLKAPYALKPGQHLKVPVAKAYEVAAGDTMTDIAKRFSVSVGELSDLNNLSVKARLRPGDVVALPDGYHDRGPTRIPATQVAERIAEPTYRPPVTVPPFRRSPTPMSGADTPGAPYVPSPEAVAAGQRAAAERANAATATPAAPRAATPYVATPVGPPQPPTAAQLAVANAGRGRFIWPVKGDVILPFGVMGIGRKNDGIDVRSPLGADVRAAAAGDVVYAGNQVPGYGNLVLVKHADGWVTAYAHLQSIGVQMRQTVMQGQTLGQVGSTGGVAEPELHFEIRYAASSSDKAKPVDPLLILPK